MKLQMFSAPARNQYLAVLVANIITFTHGSIVGWLSPALLILNSDATPLESGPLTTEEVSWVAASICAGGTLGVIISGSITTRFGNRVALICLALPHFVWWTLIIFGYHYHHLVIARTVVGLTGGALFRVIPYYLGDISQSDIRGTLGSIAPLMYNSGILLGFILGCYIPYDLIPISGVLSVSYIVIILLFIPETPPFLISQGKKEEALKSLMFYRTVDKYLTVPPPVREEFSELQKFQEFLKQDDKVSWRAFLTREARFGMGMSIFLSVLLQFSGTFVLMQFTAPIFQDAGSNVDPNEGAIIVSVLQIFGNLGSIVFVDRIGRKVMLLISCFGTAIGLAAIGTFSYIDKSGTDVSAYGWVPLISFSFAIFIVSIGIVSAPFLIAIEILPPEIKNVALTVAMAINPGVGFFTLKAFPLLLEEIHLYGVMWLFATSCLIGMLVVAIYLPETKGKDLNKV